MNKWQEELRYNPIPILSNTKNKALLYFLKRDLLGEYVDPVDYLWDQPEAERLIKKQQTDGSWRYPAKSKESFPYSNYNLIKNFRSLRVLVEKYGFNRSHPAILKSAAYVFSCQSDEGDIRGIIGNQYMPYYQGALMELLIKAGYLDEVEIKRGFEWLLAVRQNDGGWIIPFQAVPSKQRTPEMWARAPLPPDKTMPFSHMATGMVMRAFAAHPMYRDLPAARLAGDVLKSRFFKPDKYNDRKATSYWIKFQYPFWWQNILTALDALSQMDYSADDVDITKGLYWFIDNQEPDGLWDTAYRKGKKAEEMRLWVGYAVCRMMRRFYSE